MDDKEKEQQFLDRVEKAAKKGASKAGRNSSIISIVVTCLVVVGVFCYFGSKIDDIKEDLKQFVTFEDPADDHDLVIENNGIIGYTAADFEDAIITNCKEVKKIEVYEYELSDTVTVTDTGFLNWAIFSKCQLIVYKGSVVYTVDMSNIDRYDIKVDSDNKIITLYIPNASQEDININENDIQFGDVEKGLLAFGDINMTMEQASEIQKEARNRMQQKLNEMKTIDIANRFAKLCVYEMYSPIIKEVAKDYSLEVNFRN